MLSCKGLFVPIGCLFLEFITGSPLVAMTSNTKKMPNLKVCPSTLRVKVYFQFLEKEIMEHVSWLEHVTCYFKHIIYMYKITFSKPKGIKFRYIDEISTATKTVFLLHVAFDLYLVLCKPYFLMFLVSANLWNHR